MSNDILTLPTGVLAGTKFFGEFINFTEGKWVMRDKSPMTNTSKLIVLATHEKLQRWGDGVLDEEIMPTPGEMLPDIDVLNAAIPQSEWMIGVDGRPRPPWSHAHLVYLIDPVNVDRFTYSSATIGARIAINDLKERISWMSRFRGTTVHPVVTLSSRPMQTRFGMRSRPHFEVDDWVIMTGSGPAPLLIEGTAAMKTIDTSKGAPGLARAEPVTVGEELNDEVPWR